VKVLYTPTIPHCSMAQMIGLMLKVKLLRSVSGRYRIDVKVTPETHVSELDINKQLRDKERVAAALENPSIMRVIKKGIVNSDKLIV
jgi:metal-sulfur cluster biosynthetic enzyme